MRTGKFGATVAITALACLILILLNSGRKIESIHYEPQAKFIQELKDECRIDIEVWNKLKRKAARDWPDDYATQEFWLNEQKRDYCYMQKIPESSLKNKARKDWPLDFSTQKFWYNQQIEAKERMSK